MTISDTKKKIIIKFKYVYIILYLHKLYMFLSKKLTTFNAL